MLDNIKVFEECLEHLANNVDPIARETLNKVILPTEDATEELFSRNYRLSELIVSYANNKGKGDNSHNSKIISEIDNCLRYEGMNYCPFSQYLMVHDVTEDMYLNKLSNEEKQYIVDCYLDDRFQLYLNSDYSNIIFQVLTDSYSHKRKGTMGVAKLKKICNKFGIPKINDDSQVDEPLYYILPDAGDNKLFDKILGLNHINFDFRTTHQGKMPDALIKINNTFLIVEHKILKESGGGQDKQMTEIIDFIGWGERGIHYISFMDGILFNQLVNPSEKNKLFRDKQSIYINLKNCPFNYFVNEYGFNKIIDYALKKQ